MPKESKAYLIGPGPGSLTVMNSLTERMRSLTTSFEMADILFCLPTRNELEAENKLLRFMSEDDATQAI